METAESVTERGWKQPLRASLAVNRGQTSIGTSRGRERRTAEVGQEDAYGGGIRVAVGDHTEEEECRGLLRV